MPDPFYPSGNYMPELGNLGGSPQFANQARGVVNQQMAAQERAAQRQAMDQTARFNTAFGGAQTAVLGDIRNRFADAATQQAGQIGLQAAQQDLEGRRLMAGYQFSNAQAQRQQDYDNYLTQLSLNQRRDEMAQAASLGRERNQYNLLGAGLQAAGTLAGGALGGSAGGYLANQALSMANPYSRGY